MLSQTTLQDHASPASPSIGALYPKIHTFCSVQLRHISHEYILRKTPALFSQHSTCSNHLVLVYANANLKMVVICTLSLHGFQACHSHLFEFDFLYAYERGLSVKTRVGVLLPSSLVFCCQLDPEMLISMQKNTDFVSETGMKRDAESDNEEEVYDVEVSFSCSWPSSICRPNMYV